VRAILLLPVTVGGVIPALIVWRTDEAGIGSGLALVPDAVGVLLLVVGHVLVVGTVVLFAKVGEGTLAPWAPTRRLVVRGPYRHVRNPMISGVLLIVLGEATLLRSVPLLIWAGAVFAVNAVYLPVVEEPGLVRRFGPDYEAYRTNVPRWLPRVRPWDPST
jgi:protein-S-isoprenylcysteine O-methyltransferase Ste14